MAPETSWKYTYYVRDASGTVLAIYDRFYEPTEDAEVFHERFILAEAPVYGSSRLGSYRPERVVASVQWRLSDVNPATGLYNNRDLEGLDVAQFAPGEQVLSRIAGEKSYELVNHLGNVLSVVSDKKVYDRDWQADLQSSQDYYAFGMQMPGRSYNSEAYRFGFNGKENDNEVKGTGNQQDYGMRIYDPRLGRFLSIDPLSKDYPMLTPYQFASNTPIQAIDLEGLEAFYVHGTWSNQNTFSKLTVSTVNSITGNTTGRAFGWSGNNTDRARKLAARDLANHVMKYRDPNQPLTIVGHSHGGNVGIMAANILEKKGVKVDNLVTINTPVREYQLTDGAVDHHVNISQEYDPVQGGGGNAVNFPDGAIILSTPGLPTIIPLNNGTIQPTGELGPAGRTFEGAANIIVPFDKNNIHNTHNTPMLWKDKLRSAINPSPMKPYDLSPKIESSKEDNTRVSQPSR